MGSKMKEQIICFTLGLFEEDIEKGKASFYGLSREASALEVIAVTEYMLDKKVGDLLVGMVADSGLHSAERRQSKENKLSPDLYKYRVVVVNAQAREDVLQVMRSFKAVLPDPQNMIFAVVTETALHWTFGEYVGHLGAEYEYMKHHSPQDDPDMKKV